MLNDYIDVILIIIISIILIIIITIIIIIVSDDSWASTITIVDSKLKAFPLDDLVFFRWILLW